MILNEDCNTFASQYENDVNLILTSPPYNMTKRKGGWSDKRTRYDEYNDWLEYDDYIKWSIDLFNNFDNILIENGVILYNFSYSIENPSLPYQLVSAIIENTNFCIADTIVWKKNSSMPFPASPNRLQRICEFVFVFVRKDEINSFITNKKVTKVSSVGQKYYEPVPNIVEAKNNDKKTTDINQATFSTDFVLKLLRMYAKADKDFVVYDPFMGTGSTAIGCIRYGCSYIGTELSKKQVEYTNKRIDDELNSISLENMMG